MSKIEFTKPLVDAAWLKSRLNASNLLILNATLPKAGSTEEDIGSNDIGILNSRFLDIKNNFSQRDAAYPNTMLHEEAFSRAAKELGLHNDSAIVVYDDHGIYSSARAWWMFRAMGHQNVAVLNGGFKAWMELGYPTEERKKNTDYKGEFSGTYNETYFKDYKQVLLNIKDRDRLLVDARADERFKGLVEEPRQGLRSGHIPNAVNLPYTELLENNKMRSVDQIQAIFNRNFPEDKELLFSCGSGITACILALAAELTGIKNSAVYDGSWTEWGSMTELPIQKNTEQ